LGAPEPAFEGPKALAAIVRAQPGLGACVARQLFRFALGRAEQAADEPDLRKLADAWKEQNYDYRRLVLALVGSDAFRYRKGDLR
jgi:hypothetical protein